MAEAEKTKEPDLNALRAKLDVMTDRIVIGLKERSDFKLNRRIYEKGAIPIVGRPEISFLDFGLESLEIFHAALGRYDYSDQFPFFSKNLPKSPVEREIPIISVKPVEISIKDELIGYYCEFLPKLGISGDDTVSYGETVSIDSNLLMLLHERINSVGRYVAQSKLENNPEIMSNINDTGKLKAILRNPGREDIVLSKAKNAAQKYGLDPEVINELFSWIISKTIDVEILYLQKLAEQKKE